MKTQPLLLVLFFNNWGAAAVSNVHENVPICLIVIHLMNLSMWRFLQGDVNTGGIVAGVIVALLLLVLLGLGIWYANKKGYLPSEFSTLY